MGLILKKTFDGYHRWIKVDKNVKLDAMFFSANSEAVDDNLYSAEYKERATFIICNPNAMNY
jgi:hypothetical protein